MTESPIAPERAWQIDGPVPAAKLSPLYRFSAFLAALGMVLLPLIYIGMIAALGWWWWDYLQAGPVYGGKGRRSGTGSLLLYVGPLIIGVIVIVFMIKPLFSRRPKSVEPRDLTRDQEPELFSFIESICDLVRAPRPKKVQVDLQVNASASLTHGLWSILSRNLTLTIGLPLANGLTARELGGVLAHEFGHFAQGAGMGTTYVVRMVSFWFARVVYERDRWDATLDAWARESDWRIMIVLQIARFVVWLVRRVLSVLMWVGQLISSVLMRQMEFDADHYEIQTSGSSAFISTAKRLRILGLGAHITHTKQEEAFAAKRLVDDLPGWMAHETKNLPPDICEQVLKAATEEKTGWLDTHPSDAARIARAEMAKAGGVLQSDAPGAALFRDFSALCREVTGAYYRDVLDIPEKGVALEPVAKMTAESDEVKRGGDAIEKFFHGLLTPRSLVFLTAADLEVGATDLVPRNIAARAALTEPEQSAAKALRENLDREGCVHAAQALQHAKISFDAAEYKLPGLKPADIGACWTSTEAALRQSEQSLAPVLARFRSRLATALSFLLSQPDAPPEINTEIRRYISVLRCIESLAPTLQRMRVPHFGLGATLSNLDKAGDQGAVYAAVSQRAIQLNPSVEQILMATKEVAYPFEHASGTVKLADYLRDDVGHPDEFICTFLLTSAIFDRLFGTYTRIMGRLVLLAQEAEARMDAPSTAAQ